MKMWSIQSEERESHRECLYKWVEVHFGSAHKIFFNGASFSSGMLHWVCELRLQGVVEPNEGQGNGWRGRGEGILAIKAMNREEPKCEESVLPSRWYNYCQDYWQIYDFPAASYLNARNEVGELEMEETGRSFISLDKECGFYLETVDGDDKISC